MPFPVIAVITDDFYFGCMPGTGYFALHPPVTKLSNNIKITVDPRVELIAIVQYLSQYNQLMTAAEFSYRSDVDTYFHQYRNHEAVTMYDKMTKTGFIFSTPATFALGLTDSLYLDDSVHIADHVVTGGGGRAIKQFARGFAGILPGQ